MIKGENSHIEKILEKKKGSHAGFAISFIIFIGFVVFLLNIISPSIQTESGKETLVNSAEESLISKSKKDMESLSISPNYTRQSENCVEISSINLYQNHLAKGPKGKVLKSNSTHIKTPSKKEFIEIHTTNQSLNNYSSFSCSNSTNQIEKGISKKKREIFKTEMEELIANYSQNYEKTKNKLNIPEKNELEFVFILENETRKNATLQKEPKTEIFANSKPIIYMDKNATKKHGKIETRIW